MNRFDAMTHQMVTCCIWWRFYEEMLSADKIFRDQNFEKNTVKLNF
jgi:hypothetical protein